MPRQHDAGCPSRPHGKCRRLLLPTRPRLGCPCLRPCVQVERQLKLRLDPQKAKMLERARAMGATVAPEFEQGARRQEGPLPPPPPPPVCKHARPSGPACPALLGTRGATCDQRVVRAAGAGRCSLARALVVLPPCLPVLVCCQVVPCCIVLPCMPLPLLRATQTALWGCLQLARAALLQPQLTTMRM